MKHTLILLLILFSHNSQASKYFDQSWVHQAEAEMQRIRENPNTKIFDGADGTLPASLIDDTDGLHSIATSNNKAYVFRSHTLEKMRSLNGDASTLGIGGFNQNIIIRNCLLRANIVTEALKVSLSKNIIIEDCRIDGGKEDAFDTVRGKNIYFKNVEFNVRGEYAMTIKGSSHNINIINCHFYGSPTSGVYIDLGNWSDYNIYDRPKTRDIRIDDQTTFADRRIDPVRTIFAERPVFNGKVNKMSSFYVDAFFSYQKITQKSKVEKNYTQDSLRWDLNHPEW